MGKREYDLNQSAGSDNDSDPSDSGESEDDDDIASFMADGPLKDAYLAGAEVTW